MGFFDDVAQKYGFSVDASDQAAFEQGRLSEDEIAARMERRGGSTSHRPHDSQTTDEAAMAANAAADASVEPMRSGTGGPLYGGTGGPLYGGGSYAGDTRDYGASSGGGGGGEGFGAAPAPFGETYTALGRPSWLQGQYAPGQWNEQFTAPGKPGVLQTPYALPTQADLEASPGYLAGQDAMQRGMERSAAAKGSVLSGGFVGRALPRAMGEYAGSAYNSLAGNTLAARGQQYGEYSGDVSNAFSQYQQRYGQFADAESMKMGARNTNETAFQGDQGSNLAGYSNRYGQYLDQAGMRRQADQDLWQRNLDVSDLSLRAAALARP